MFERRHAPLLPTSHFVRRLIAFAALYLRDRGQLAGAGHGRLSLFRSGVAFLSTVAVLFAPLVHRFFHHFHLEGPRRSDLA